MLPPRHCQISLEAQRNSAAAGYFDNLIDSLLGLCELALPNINLGTQNQCRREIGLGIERLVEAIVGTRIVTSSNLQASHFDLRRRIVASVASHVAQRLTSGTAITLRQLRPRNKPQY